MRFAPKPLDVTMPLMSFVTDRASVSLTWDDMSLQPIFASIRDEGGYDLILNYAPGVVVTLSERIDITSQVVERLNAATAE